MQPSAVVETLAAEGISLELSVRAKGELTDEHRALIRENRDALLEHLARGAYGRSNGTRVSHFQRAGSLHLHGDLLLNLMVWAAQHQELRLERPGGVVLNARPEHIRDALERYPWGVVYDSDRRVLVTWGDVPRVTLLGLRDLETDEALIPEAVAA